MQSIVSDPDWLQQLLESPESPHLEFKEAKQNFQFDKLVEYCAAISNGGGGKFVLGITDRRPRTICGTQAFEDPGKTCRSLWDKLSLDVKFRETKVEEKRILVFEVPAHRLGHPVTVEGRYLIRSGDSVRGMTPDEVRAMVNEGSDYSAETVAGAGLADLDRAAVEDFRQRWLDKSRNDRLLDRGFEEVLADAQLIVNGKLTVAALVLFGTPEAVGRFLPQAEVIFEYRSGEGAAYQQRLAHRCGFFLFLEELWRTIDSRNEIVQAQQGLFVIDIPAFNERVVREALLNAITHREYAFPDSIRILQQPTRLEIVSPGGFPPGVTVENIFRKQVPRNRRIAEACEKCGLVERSSQGVDLMFEKSIREGKARPDYSGSDDRQVSLVLRGEIEDPGFVRLLDRVAEELSPLSLEDLLLLDDVRQGESLGGERKRRAESLVEKGILEKVGRTRGVRYIFSRRVASVLGRPGSYTRSRGLDKEANKQLLLRHISESRLGARFEELQQVVPGLSRGQIQGMLRELRDQGLVRVAGLKRGARWYGNASS
ncbi:MAG: ATP-binding protein [Bryobacteraceae bacterium]|nr:ATP-binding protein [Bryobacteraceae bacterium]